MQGSATLWRQREPYATKIVWLTLSAGSTSLLQIHPYWKKHGNICIVSGYMPFMPAIAPRCPRKYSSLSNALLRKPVLEWPSNGNGVIAFVKPPLLSPGKYDPLLRDKDE
jgi:hypothetical protein